MIFRFERFDADDVAFRLIADGIPVALEPKALRLLLYLIQNRGRLIRKQELLNAVWMDAAVTESALTRSVGLLRKALDDDSRAPRFIETVPTVGFRFIAQVYIVVDAEPDVKCDTAPSVPPPIPTPLAQSSLRTTSRYRIAAAIVICLSAVAAVWFFAGRHRTAAPISSLAVLPLDNLSGDPTQEYFADGMTDELITELARIPNLRIVSRTSVLAGKGTHLPLSAIASQFDVDAIIEGSIVRSGGRIRITTQLVDARTDRHLWAQSFEGSDSDILSLQDSVAQQIAVQARLVLAPAAPHVAVNPAAHDAYLRGRYFFDKQDFSHSLESFQQAVALDAAYASAFAGYASALDAAATFSIGTPEQLMPRAVAAAQRAIELDPQNGEAYTALGSVETIYEWNWTAAEQNIELVFSGGDLDLQLRDGSGGIGERGGGAVGFEFGGDSIEQTVIEDAVAAGIGIGRGALNRHVLIELQQLEIAAGNVTHQCDHDTAPGFVRGEILRARGLAGTTDAAPQVNLPRGVQVQLRGGFGGAIQGGG